MSIDPAELARIVDDAAASGTAIPQLSHTYGEVSVEAAYGIQALSIARRLARGERMVGLKMGFTSRAKMIQMGLSDQIWGRLTSGMQIADGGTLHFDRYVHPRFEPEVAFLLKKPLSGPTTPAQALTHVEAVAPAMEIIDSRYKDFKFSLSDVVADNSSSSSFVLGKWCSPDLDMSNLGMVCEVDGRPVQIGSTAAILGHPLRSLVAASRIAAEHGLELKAGWTVMAGAATAATFIKPGQHLRVVAEKMGTVDLFVS
ncbi:MAG: 2-keto-4-pentenoate hydratase [Myxococcota bacterium]